MVSILKHLKHKEKLFAGHMSLISTFEGTAPLVEGPKPPPTTEEIWFQTMANGLPEMGVNMSQVMNENSFSARLLLANYVQDEDEYMISGGGCHSKEKQDVLFEGEECPLNVKWEVITAL